MEVRRYGGEGMPIYVMLTNLTERGRETVAEKPERIKEVNKEVEALGVKIIAQYALFGPYDFINILEAPDNDTAMKVAVKFGARGTITTMTFPAVPVDELIESLK